MPPEVQAEIAQPGSNRVVWYSVYRPPERARSWDLWDVRESVQELAMSNIAKSAPSAVVIGFQVFDEATAVRVYKAGKRLVQDLRYSSAMLYSHDVSISVVLIRDDKELDLFEEKVWNGYFHGSSIRWAGVVEAAELAADGERPR